MKLIKPYNKFIFESNQIPVVDKTGQPFLKDNKSVYYDTNRNTTFWEILKLIEEKKFKSYQINVYSFDDGGMPLIKNGVYFKTIFIGIRGLKTESNLSLRLSSYDKELLLFIQNPKTKFKPKLPIIGDDGEKQIMELMKKSGIQNPQLKIVEVSENESYSKIVGTYQNSSQIVDFFDSLSEEGIRDSSNKLVPFATYIQKNKVA